MGRQGTASEGTGPGSAVPGDSGVLAATETREQRPGVGVGPVHGAMSCLPNRPSGLGAPISHMSLPVRCGPRIPKPLVGAVCCAMLALCVCAVQADVCRAVSGQARVHRRSRHHPHHRGSRCVEAAAGPGWAAARVRSGAPRQGGSRGLGLRGWQNGGKQDREAGGTEAGNGGDKLRDGPQGVTEAKASVLNVLKCWMDSLGLSYKTRYMMSGGVVGEQVTEQVRTEATPVGGACRRPGS